MTQKKYLPLVKIWRWLTSPLFTLRLIASGSWSYLQLSLIKIKPYQSIIFSLIIFIFALLFVSSQRLNEENLLKKNSLNRRQLIVLQKQLEAALQQQPTHRDILFNLAKISQELGQDEQARLYQQRAQELDPNHPLFTHLEK